MGLENEVSPIEALMESALRENNIPFDKQVPCYGEKTYKNHYGYYRKKSDHPKYILDFVVFGKKSKIAVECDGFRYHSSNKQKASDAIRDLWTITNGYDDVLRFTSRDIYDNMPSCIEKVKNALSKMERIYHQQAEKKHIQPSTFFDSPPKNLVMKTMSEFLTILTHVFKKEKRQKKYLNKKTVINGVNQRLRKYHFNLSYDPMHFQFPEIIKPLNDQKIDIFFSGYNVPYLVYLDPSPSILPNHIIESSQFMKVIISKSKPRIASLKNWIWINSLTTKIMASDLLDIDFNDSLLHDLSKKASALEEQIVQACLQKGSAIQIKQELREVYKKMYQVKRKNRHYKVELFTELNKSQRTSLTKELKSHWSWIVCKTKNIDQIDSFEIAYDWFEERVIQEIEKYPLTLHDVAIQMHQFKLIDNKGPKI